MRRSVSVACVLVLVLIAWGAYANQELIQLQTDDKQWVMPGKDYSATRFSTLNQITRDNVKNLRPAWTFSTGTLRGHEGAPLVIGDTMYVHTSFPNNVYALDLKGPDVGQIKWKYLPKQDPSVQAVACCDNVNRGLSYADGKVFLNQLDGTLVALDAKTGKEAWKAENADPKVGATMTGAPHVMKDKVIVGVSGGEFGVRGHVTAYDIKTGQRVWRAYSMGPDEEILLADDFNKANPHFGQKNQGVATWQGDQWTTGGGTTWGWYAFDPALNLMYYGTGNPSTWNPSQRPGDNKWSMTIFARNPDNGEARWAYQMTPHDAWDYDGVNENILADIQVNGRQRKVLVHPDRNGFVYTLDRETGEVITADKFVFTNWADRIDLRTGRPVENPAYRTREGVVTHGICPSSTGGKDEPPGAFSPATGWFYFANTNDCMDYEGLEANYIAGTPYVGASVKMYAGPGGKRGGVNAWDAARGKAVWHIDENFPVWSGVLVTAGGVVFYGTMDGWFKAVDARDGRELWKFKVGSGIVGNPISYTGPDGKQYIAVYSGIGGWMGAVAFPDVSTDDPYTALGVAGAIPDIKKASTMGGMLYVFSL